VNRVASLKKNFIMKKQTKSDLLFSVSNFARNVFLARASKCCTYFMNGTEKKSFFFVHLFSFCFEFHIFSLARRARAKSIEICKIMEGQTPI
jgi:hypothetical protein